MANRKEQIEKNFLPVLLRRLRKAGCEITPAGRELIKEELKSAALVGACEERSHCLALLNAAGEAELARTITSRSVFDVLGYENS